MSLHISYFILVPNVWSFLFNQLWQCSYTLLPPAGVLPNHFSPAILKSWFAQQLFSFFFLFLFFLEGGWIDSRPFFFLYCYFCAFLFFFHFACLFLRKKDRETDKAFVLEIRQNKNKKTSSLECFHIFFFFFFCHF